MKRGFIAVVLLLVLFGCANEKEFYVGSFQPDEVLTPKVLRPEIERTEMPVEPVPEVETRYELPKPEPKEVVPELSTPVEEYRLKIGYGLIRANSSLGSTSKKFTKYEFPELLKSRTVRSGSEPITARYSQELKLLGGRVKFTNNEEDVAQDYLVYEDGENIYEYYFYLGEGNFLEFIGEKIQFLGNIFVIDDVTKEDVTLVNEENQIVIGGGKVHLNGETLEDTDSRMTGNEIFLVAKADPKIEGDDIFISPGESLLEHMDELTLLTSHIDIRYIGLSEVPHHFIEFNNKDEELELRTNGFFDNNRFPIGFITSTGFRLGDEEGKMHVRESTNASDYKVARNDYVLMATPRITKTNLMDNYRKGYTHIVSEVLQYKGHNENDKSIEFASPKVAIEAFYNGTPGNNAFGYLHYYGKKFRFNVGSGPDYPIAIDLNGDKLMRGSFVDIYLGDAIVSLPNQEEFTDSANVTVTLLNYEGMRMKDEQFIVRINPNGEFDLELFTDLEIVEVVDSDYVTISPFGTHYLILDKSGDEFKELIINHPLQERLAEIVVESN